MNPAARVQAAIELLDAVIVAARDQGPAADTLIARGLAARRYAGAKDRRAIRELVYDAIRLVGERPQSGRAAMLALVAARPELGAAFDGSTYGPAPIGAGEPIASAGIAPAWVGEALASAGLDHAEQAALLSRAPLDVRVNTLKASPDALIAELPGACPIAGLPDGLRLAADTPVEKTPAFLDGRIEVQDAGSQWVALAAGAEPGQQLVDLCAGGGGKTLALAAAMANRGAILACDADRARLSRLGPRAARAGVTIAQTRLLDPHREGDALTDWHGRADLVLVDAPCSGVGTWRRNPEARWRITPDRLQRLVETQARLLRVGAALVRPGGALVHVVCSLLDAEGADQARAFLDAHPGWVAAPIGIAAGSPHGPGVRFTPMSHSTDGFFVAKMVRP